MPVRAMYVHIHAHSHIHTHTRPHIHNGVGEKLQVTYSSDTCRSMASVRGGEGAGERGPLEYIKVHAFLPNITGACS